ncbi:MAG: hypothetical protein A2V67_07050 [Deltaproteobacteria bacterium RBG_13_61_14]|nr:MAG: hypothetical protein A2V67_07050 [Deltaproteobacteria bacterium RBG_13_61_14]
MELKPHEIEAKQIEIEERKVALQHKQIKLDLIKWVIGGVVVIVGFLLIRPREQNRLDQAFQLEVSKAYIAAVQSGDLDLWQRSLNQIEAFNDDKRSKLGIFIESEKGRLQQARKEHDMIINLQEEITKITAEKGKLDAEFIKVKNDLGNYNFDRNEANNKMHELQNNITEKEIQLFQISNQLKETQKRLGSGDSCKTMVPSDLFALCVSEDERCTQCQLIKKYPSGNIYFINCFDQKIIIDWSGAKK